MNVYRDSSQSNESISFAHDAAKIWTFLRNGADASQSSESSICVRVAAKICERLMRNGGTPTRALPGRTYYVV